MHVLEPKRCNIKTWPLIKFKDCNILLFVAAVSKLAQFAAQLVVLSAESDEEEEVF